MAIDGLKKHQGLLKNTGVRVAVVFRKLPTDDNFCLVVETERLPDSYHDYIIQTLGSREAAETNDFYEILNRRTFPDGTNCLTSLHQRGFLRKEPVSNITMVPLPGQSVPLELINATIDKKINEYMAKQNAATVPEAVIPELVGDPVAQAKGLILQADIMEEDARAKRELAYTLAPDLKPGKGRPALPEEIMAEKMEERKEKRRARDQRNAAEAKIEKKAAELEARVNAKILRDAARKDAAKKELAKKEAV